MESRALVRGTPGTTTIALVFIVTMLLPGSVVPSRAQSTPDIDHDPLPCIRVGEYPVVDAEIEPGKEVRTAKVYFRADHYPKFYWVEMVIYEDAFVSVLPKPGPGTKRIIYYIEALDVGFNNTTDLERDPEVREVCEHQPAYAPGDEPGIIVGATEAGASPFPPGFETAGIIGTVATTGVLTSGVGGGAGIGTFVAVGGAAAGATGAVVVANQPPPEESTTTVFPTGSATTTIPSTPGSPTATTTTTVPGPSSTTTTIVASTTTVAGGTTTTIVGGTTTIPATTTTTPPALDASCFTVTVLGNCRVRVDASCVALPVDRYEWLLDVADKWKRIDIPDGPASLVQNWSGDCDDDPEMIRFRLKVHRGGETSTSNKDIVIPGNDLRAPPQDGSLRVRFQTHLELPPFDGSQRGHVIVNGTNARVVDNAQPVIVQSAGGTGVNSVVATLLQTPREPGLWRFDFTGAPSFANGTLRVVQGNVVRLDNHAVVFRLTGESNERVEFTFELRR